MKRGEPEVVAFVRRRLAAERDLKYRDFSAPLLKTALPLEGVRLPRLHSLAKEILERDPEGYLDPRRSDRCWEETMLRGLVIAHAKWEPARRLAHLRAYVERLGDWSVCDSPAMALKALKRQQEAYWGFLEELARGEGEFKVRFGLVCLMDHYLEEAWLPRLFALLPRVGAREFYVRMGLAWFLTTALTKFPLETLQFLRRSRKSLDPEVLRLTVRKCRESRAVARDVIEIITNLSE